MGDVDDKTSALIAKLLSEDNAYADYFEQEYALEESDDSDYGGNGRKKKAKKGTDLQACLLIFKVWVTYCRPHAFGSLIASI